MWKSDLFCAGDIHTGKGLVSRMPSVCSALRSKIDKLCNVEILDIKAPPRGQGVNFYVTYKILEAPNEPLTVPKFSEKEVRGKQTGIPELIRELAELKEGGLITAGEYEKKKKELLERL